MRETMMIEQSSTSQLSVDMTRSWRLLAHNPALIDTVARDKMTALFVSWHESRVDITSNPLSFGLARALHHGSQSACRGSCYRKESICDLMLHLLLGRASSPANVGSSVVVFFLVFIYPPLRILKSCWLGDPQKFRTIKFQYFELTTCDLGNGSTRSEQNKRSLTSPTIAFKGKNKVSLAH